MLVRSVILAVPLTHVLTCHRLSLPSMTRRGSLCHHGRALGCDQIRHLRVGKEACRTRFALRFACILPFRLCRRSISILLRGDGAWRARQATFAGRGREAKARDWRGCGQHEAGMGWDGHVDSVRRPTAAIPPSSVSLGRRAWSRTWWTASSRCGKPRGCPDFSWATSESGESLYACFSLPSIRP